MKIVGGVKLNLAVSWLTHAVGLLIGIFLMPYVLHTLGDESYGTWILLNSFLGYSCFFYLGFGETVCRFVAKFHAREEWDKLNESVNVVLFIYLGMGALAFAVAGIVAWLAPSFHDWGAQPISEVRAVILIMGLTVFLSMSTCVFGGVLTGIQRFDIERSMNLISGILRLVLTIIFLQGDWGLLTLATIFLIVTLAEHIGHIVFAFRLVPTLSIGLKHFKKATAKKLASFSGFEFLSLMSVQCMEVTDTVIIGVVLGAKACVPYYIAIRLTKFIKTPIQLIGRVFMPKAGQLQAQNQGSDLQALVTKGFGFAFLLTMGLYIGAVFFGDSLITTWVGPGYENNSYILLLILLGAQVVATPTELIRSVLFGLGHVREQALMNLAKAITNIGLSLLLVRQFGILGVAIATTIPIVLIELFVLLPFGARKLQFQLGHFVRESLTPQMAALFALLGYSYLITQTIDVTPGWWNMLGVAAGGGAVLAIVWLTQYFLERGQTTFSSPVGDK